MLMPLFYHSNRGGTLLPGVESVIPWETRYHLPADGRLRLLSERTCRADKQDSEKEMITAQAGIYSTGQKEPRGVSGNLQRRTSSSFAHIHTA